MSAVLNNFHSPAIFLFKTSRGIRPQFWQCTTAARRSAAITICGPTEAIKSPEARTVSARRLPANSMAGFTAWMPRCRRSPTLTYSGTLRSSMVTTRVASLCSGAASANSNKPRQLSDTASGRAIVAAVRNAISRRCALSLRDHGGRELMGPRGMLKTAHVSVQLYAKTI
jgi:hypothetical protein